MISNWLVADAIQNRHWVRDISGGLSAQALAQYLKLCLWDIVEAITLVPEQPDVAVWRGAKDGVFSSNLHIDSTSWPRPASPAQRRFGN
jgi:hypothetical protein